MEKSKLRLHPLYSKLKYSNKKLRIALVSDFFYPRIGGVEMHIYLLGQSLMQLGHKVIVITNTHDDRQGVRYLSNGLKVYYTPIHAWFSQTSLPTFFCRVPIFRYIYIREGIQIVHGHQSSSMIIHEALNIAKAMNLKTWFTDHSLFNFSDPENIILHKLGKTMLSELDAAIWVSQVNKANLLLRYSLSPTDVHVIGNAVNAGDFTPDTSLRNPKDKINIIVLSRLSYRKGIDLVAKVIPKIWEKYPKAYFIIAGDGIKMPLLKSMQDKYSLHEQMEFLGAIPHHKVRNVFCRGHIFINWSLIEAFCNTILEAASCGLLVVSTNVGGIPEVLPHDMIYLADADEISIQEKLEEAMARVDNIPSDEFHKRVKSMYSWKKVAIKTEKVYETMLEKPFNSVGDRLKIIFSAGPFNGFFLAMIQIIYLIVYAIWEWLVPRNNIDIAVDFDLQKYVESKSSIYNICFSRFT